MSMLPMFPGGPSLALFPGGPVLQMDAISPTTIGLIAPTGQVVAGAAFQLAAQLGHYAAEPTLSYSVDGLAFLPLPGTLTWTPATGAPTSVSWLQPALAAGSHTIVVQDSNGVQSAPLTVVAASSGPSAVFVGTVPGSGTVGIALVLEYTSQGISSLFWRALRNGVASSVPVALQAPASGSISYTPADFAPGTTWNLVVQLTNQDATAIYAATAPIVIEQPGGHSIALQTVGGTINPGSSYTEPFTLTGYVGANPSLTLTHNGTSVAPFTPTFTHDGSGNPSGGSFTVAAMSATGDTLVLADPANGVQSSVFVQATGASPGPTPPGTPGALPALRIQATSAIAVGDPISIGHFFAYSDVAAGSFQKLTVTSGAATAPVSALHTNAAPDGSLRSATTAFLSPIAIAAGATATLQLGIGSSAISGAPVTSTQLLTFLGSKDVVLTASGGSLTDGPYTVSARDILANFPAWNLGAGGWGTNPLGGWEVLDSGPVRTDFRLFRCFKRSSDGASHRWIQIGFDLYVWRDGAGGIAAVECFAESMQPNIYGPHPLGTAGAASGNPQHTADYTLSVGGTTVGTWAARTTFSGNTLTFAGADANPFWVAGTRSGTRPQYQPAHDFTYLTQKTRLLPTYDPALLAFAPVDAFNFVYQVGAPSTYSDAGGDGPDDDRIGILNQSSVGLLLQPFNPKRDVRCKSVALNFHDYYVAWKDERTGRYLGRASKSYSGLIANPTLTMHSPGTGSPAWQGYNGPYSVAYGSIVDGSHLPHQWVVPFLRTGYPKFLDLGTRETIAALASEVPDTRDWIWGPGSAYTNLIFAPNLQQVRGQGWATAQLGFSECMMPDSDVHRPLIRDAMDENSRYGVDITGPNTFMPATVRTLGMLPEYKGGLPYWKPWMSSYCAQGLAMQAWREQLSGTRPGFEAFLRACQPYLIGWLDDANGGNGFAAAAYQVWWSQDDTAPDDAHTAYPSIQAVVAAYLAGRNDEGITSSTNTSRGFVAFPGGFDLRPVYQGTGPTPPSGVPCVVGSVPPEIMASLPLLAYVGVPRAREVWTALNARANDSGAGFHGPTWWYQNPNYSNNLELSCAHAIIIPAGM